MPMYTKQTNEQNASVGKADFNNSVVYFCKAYMS